MQRLGGFEIIRSLGDGGFGEVFLARRAGAAGFQRQVAIKRLRDSVARDPDLVALFAREAQICGHLHHPNVIEVYDFIDTPDGLLLIMELLEGLELRRALKDFTRQGRALPLGLCVEITRQLCAGLLAVHIATDEKGTPLGLIHRDIKPANLMLTRQGQVKIMDFGIARADFARTETGANALKGTIKYMAPEQALGQHLTPRVDQFAVGLLLAEMVLGRAVYTSPSPVIMNRRVMSGDVTHELSLIQAQLPSFHPILARALAGSPEARYPDLAAMSAALAQLTPELPPCPTLAEVIQGLMEGRDEPTRCGRPLPGAEVDEPTPSQLLSIVVEPSLASAATTPQMTQDPNPAGGLPAPERGESEPTVTPPTTPAEATSSQLPGPPPPAAPPSPSLTIERERPIRPRRGLIGAVVASSLAALSWLWTLRSPPPPEPAAGSPPTLVPSEPSAPRAATPTLASPPAALPATPPKDVGDAPTPARQATTATPAPPPPEAPPQRKAMGAVMLRTIPASQMKVNGEPLAGLATGGEELPVGTHRVELRSYDGREASVSIEVQAGTLRRYLYTFSTDRLDLVSSSELP